MKIYIAAKLPLDDKVEVFANRLEETGHQMTEGHSRTPSRPPQRKEQVSNKILTSIDYGNSQIQRTRLHWRYRVLPWVALALSLVALLVAVSD